MRLRRLRRGPRCLPLLLPAGVLFLVSCFGGGDGGDSTATPAARTPTATAAPAEPTAVPTSASTATPAAPPTTTGGGGEVATHIVVAGDTLWGIAERYNSTVEAIQEASGRSAGDTVIVVGEELRIPVGVRAEPVDSTRAVVTTDDLNVRLGPALEHAVLGRLDTGDEVEVVGLSGSRAWLALRGLGWVFYDPTWIQVDVDLARLRILGDGDPATTGPSHPRDVRTRVAAMDEVIDVVLGADLAAMEALIRMARRACRTGSGEAGGPPQCPDGIADGTPIEVFPVSSCEGGYVLREHLADALDRWRTEGPGARATATPLGMYAVLEPSAEASAIFGGAAYGALFTFESGEGRIAWVGAEGGVTGLSMGCGVTSPGRLARLGGDAPTFLLPPVVAPPLAAVE